MEIIAIIIGVIGSVFTIWEFIVVRLKKRAISKGINLGEFNEKLLPSFDTSADDDEFRIPEESDLNKGDWSWVYDGENIPFITYGNFFGDGKLSEALILINKETEQAKIVVRRYCESNFLELMSPSNSPYNIQLRTVPLGEYKSHWEKLNLKLEVHGIRVSFLESSEVIMYWDKETSSFKEYWTAD